MGLFTGKYLQPGPHLFDDQALGGDSRFIINGTFTQANGLEIPDYVVYFDGENFSPLDLEIPGTSSQSGSFISNLVDDLYIGFVGAGNGTYPTVNLNVNNGGTAKSYPIVKITRSGGTSVNLTRLANTRTGAEVLFDYEMADGETVTLDFRPGRLNASSNRQGTIFSGVLPQSILVDFFLLPGINGMVFHRVEVGSPTVTATIEWLNNYWSID